MVKRWLKGLAGILLGLVLFTGCLETALIGVGAGGAMAGYKWMEGTMIKEYPRSLPEMEQAVQKVCKQYRIKITERKVTPTKATLAGVDQNGDDYGDGILQETFWSLGLGWGYWFSTGTSMASPHVAGVAALIKSVHPEYGPDEIRQVLQESAEDLGTPGWDERYGYGLVDALAAVSY